MKGCLWFIGCFIVVLIVGFIVMSPDGTKTYRTKHNTENNALLTVRPKLRKIVVEMQIQERKLKAAGYTQKQIDDANFKLLETAHNTWTDAEKQAFYKAATQTFRKIGMENAIEKLRSRQR